MSRLPDFASIDWQAPQIAAPEGAAAPDWITPEGIPVKPVYGEADLAGLDFLDTWPGIAPY